MTSPDQKLVASLVQVDPGGGAAVAFSDFVYLNEAGHDNRDVAQFEGYSCGPISIAWKDNRTLQISYQPHCHINKFDSIWVPSSDLRAEMLVELVLNREDARSP